MEDFIKRGTSRKVHAKTGKNFQRGGGKFLYLASIYICLILDDYVTYGCADRPDTLFFWILGDPENNIKYPVFIAKTLFVYKSQISERILKTLNNFS